MEGQKKPQNHKENTPTTPQTAKCEENFTRQYSTFLPFCKSWGGVEKRKSPESPARSNRSNRFIFTSRLVESLAALGNYWVRGQFELYIKSK